MGGRYFLYRLMYEFTKRTGLLKRRFPTSPEIKHFITLEDWKKQRSNFYFDDRESLVFKKSRDAELASKVEKILNGQLLFFNSQWFDIGENHDWITNPSNKFTYSIDKHWTEIEDYSKTNGDIKYVWEKSRFSYLLTLLKYDYHFDEDHSEFVFSEIDSWINANPINKGPNWRCSQEMSLRLINWCFALNFYKNSLALTDHRWTNYQHIIFWHLHHIYEHINFSRIAVRNNHAITETMMLSLSAFFFPFIPETKVWSKNGRNWFEEEVEYQIYQDGTYLQFSMNYHRVVIQLLTVGIRLAELNGKPFSELVYERAKKSIEFLYTCQSPSGYVPNYGANDGALFFPWSDDFLDYSPQLEALHRVVNGTSLYGQDFEDCNWWGWDSKSKSKKVTRKEGVSYFDIGGYVVIRDKDALTFLRAGSHKDRPSQADNLHLDLWVNDDNILHDGGSFSYNSEETVLKYYFGTASHNTVQIAEYDQMLKGQRFIWFNWSQCQFVNINETQDEYVIEASIKAFEHVKSNIIHKRTVSKKKHKPEWAITDVILGAEDFKKYQLWHGSVDIINQITPGSESMKVCKSIADAPYSLYYGLEQLDKVAKIEFEDKITSIIKLS
ncbi:MAG: alginate lyase family protein [Fulvivirga sp.]